MASVEKDVRPHIGFNLSDFNSTTQLTEKGKPSEEEQYNPFEHRNVEKPSSTSGALAHLLKSSLGTGILAMPMAFKNSGLLVGALGTIIVGYLCTHAVHIFVKTSQEVCVKARIPSLGYADTAGKAFELGPAFSRRYATLARRFCDYGMLATYLSAGCVYIVFVATTFHDMFNYLLNLDLDVRIYIAIVIVPMALLGQIRILKYLVPFSAMANVFIVVTFGITLYYLFSGEMRWDERPLSAPITHLPQFLSTVIFAMEGIGVVMPVENDMKKPQHFLGCPGVLNTAMITVILLYGVIGFFGFLRYGDAVQGSVTMNLPEGVIAAQIAQFLIGIAILFTFGLQFYVPMEVLWRKIQHRIRKENHNVAQILMRSGCIFIMGGVAAAIPKLEPFIGLVGAIFFSALGLFVPAITDTVHRWQDHTGGIRWNLLKNMLLAVFAIIALLTGSITSIKEIIHMYTHDSHNA